MALSAIAADGLVPQIGVSQPRGQPLVVAIAGLVAESQSLSRGDQAQLVELGEALRQGEPGRFARGLDGQHEASQL